MPFQPTSKTPSLAKIKATLKAEQQKALMDCARFVRSKAATYPPKAGGSYKRTGTLGRSITIGEPQISQAGGAWVEVGTNLKYARYVEEGTGLYGPKGSRIYPKGGKVLAWPVTGASTGGKLIAMGLARRKGKVVNSPAKNVSMIFARSTKGMPGWQYMKKAFEHPSTVAYLKQRIVAMFGAIQKALDGAG